MHELEAREAPEASEMPRRAEEAPFDPLLYRRNMVRAAILLAAAGSYGVVLANLPGCRALADEFRAEAARNGVSIALENHGEGRVDIRLTRV